MLRYIDMRYEGEAYAKKARIIYNEIWKYKTTFLDLLNHPLPKVRQEAFSLLIQYPEYIEIAPRLLLQLEQEKDDQTKAMMFWFWQFDVSEFDSLLTKTVELSKTWLTNDHHISLRATATFFLTRFLKENAPQECDAILVHIMSWHPDSLVFHYPVNPSNCLVSLGDLGKERGISAALKVVKQAQNRAINLIAMLVALLLAFNRLDLLTELNRAGYSSDRTGITSVTFLKPQREEYLRRNSELTDHQKQVLYAAVTNDAIWSVKSNLFSILGLPSQRENLAKILKEAE